MTPDPLHPSLDTMTRDQLVRLLRDHLSEDLALDPEGGPHAQRAKLLLDRLGLLDVGPVNPVLHAELANIDGSMRRIGILLSQQARGG